MDGLLSLLLFAVLFFVMMRFGCGAHMKHGHEKNHGKSHDHTKHGGDQKKHVDPVCGMDVDIEQGYGKMYEGKLYRFCSRDCLDKFETKPERYITNNITNEKHHHEGGML